jgi:transcriptional regulator with XRE-family HTH domain
VNASRSTLAHVLRTLRADQQVDQLQLALAMGAGGASYLSKLENGRRVNPGRSFLRRYVAAYALLGRPLNDAQRDLLANAVLARPEAA